MKDETTGKATGTEVATTAGHRDASETKKHGDAERWVAEMGVGSIPDLDRKLTNVGIGLGAGARKAGRERSAR